MARGRPDLGFFSVKAEFALPASLILMWCTESQVIQGVTNRVSSEQPLPVPGLCREQSLGCTSVAPWSTASCQGVMPSPGWLCHSCPEVPSKGGCAHRLLLPHAGDRMGTARRDKGSVEQQLLRG